ncbi:hypothetical protein B0H15DRAFT_159107 [Mycena belliarum]|uniref:Uncharacterized protein n=1 Tax=Mycena belliarum TaxID=1033014 RepID=A0AAD6XWS1_9AGAR|nr:hypothetical protein B0H15DRAFT_159107 [Mycena belliae]
MHSESRKRRCTAVLTCPVLDFAVYTSRKKFAWPGGLGESNAFVESKKIKNSARTLCSSSATAAACTRWWNTIPILAIRTIIDQLRREAARSDSLSSPTRSSHAGAQWLERDTSSREVLFRGAGRVGRLPVCDRKYRLLRVDRRLLHGRRAGAIHSLAEPVHPSQRGILAALRGLAALAGEARRLIKPSHANKDPPVGTFSFVSCRGVPLVPRCPLVARIQVSPPSRWQPDSAQASGCAT